MPRRRTGLKHLPETCWGRLLAAPQPAPYGSDPEIALTGGFSPFHAAEILASGLHSPGGIFQHVVASDVAKLGATVRTHGRIRSYALLVPIQGRCQASAEDGLFGLLGAFTDPAFRGRGFASLAMRALSDHLEDILAGMLGRAFLAAEARLVPLAQEAFVMPVLGRWSDERPPLWKALDAAYDRRATLCDKRAHILGEAKEISP